MPPVAGGFARKPPASGGWGLRPQTPIGLQRLGAPLPDPQNSPLHCEFLATRLTQIFTLNPKPTPNLTQTLTLTLKKQIKNVWMNIPHFCFIIFINIFAAIVTPKLILYIVPGFISNTNIAIILQYSMLSGSLIAFSICKCWLKTMFSG